MGFIIGLFTLIMVLDCVVLIMLVLIQLPKKEAGAGLAFGGGATDALFGAGSGNVLTKVTKWSAVLFFSLAVVLSLLQRSYHNRSSNFLQNLEHPAQVPATAPLLPGTSNAPAAKPAFTPTATNLLQSTPATVESTNVPAPGVTSPAATAPTNPVPQK